MGLIDSIIGAESGGNPNAQNSRSSAGGLGQFIDSTWLDTIRSARPDIAQGKSDADLLALKMDPQLSREMTAYYANQNQAHLARNGLPVTDGTTYLAHFAGAGGATRVLQADPNTPVSQILRADAIEANPFLAKMTAGDLQAWANRKGGGGTSMMASAPAAPASPTNAIPQQPAPVFAQAPQAQAQAAPPMQFEPPPQAPPILTPPKRPINLTALRAAFSSPSFYQRG